MLMNGFICRALFLTIYKAEQIKKPLENYRDIDLFKVYVSVLGLLSAKKSEPWYVLYRTEEINGFKVGMVENYVNTSLAANG